MSVLQPRANGGIYGATIRERLLFGALPVPSGCWIWQRSLDDKGYPRMGIRATGEQYAHRASYVEFLGRPIPEGMTVDHLCFTPACINPAHLEVVPAAANSSRRQTKFSGYCRNGHEFTEENTKWVTKRGWRSRNCRICERARSAAARQKRRDAASEAAS